MSRVTAIKADFEAAPHGREVPLEELKALSNADRDALASLAALKLGDELDRA